MQDDWGIDTGGTATEGQWEVGGVGHTVPERKRFHLSLLIYGLVGSALGALAGAFIYRCMYNPSGGNIVMVGLILAIISAFVLLACSICELFYPRITMSRELDLPRILQGLLVALVVFVVGCLCECIYEWNSAYSAIEFNDYVFAIDDSGSMFETDPSELRYSALEALLGTMGEEKRVGLVRFCEIVYDSVELNELDDEQRTRLSEELSLTQADGGTDIYEALKASLNMHLNNTLPGRIPVVVLLSDGFSEVPFDRTVREFLDAGIAVSTVSLGPNTDEVLLQELAQATGGQYFKVEEANDLVQAFQQVSTAVAYRCLFSPRPGPQRGNVPYMVLRVLFLALPGIFIGLFILLLLQSRLANRQLLVSSVAGLVAGLAMEVGTYFILPFTVMQVLSWILYGIVLLQYYDNASGMRQTRLETAGAGIGAGGSSGWEDITIEPHSDIDGEISRRRSEGSGRIDRKDDRGSF